MNMSKEFERSFGREHHMVVVGQKKKKKKKEWWSLVSQQNIKNDNCLAGDFAEISFKYNVSAIPKLILFSDGGQVDLVDGADPIRLNKKNPSTGDKIDQKAKEQNMRLKSLLNSSPVLIFMKASKSEPKFNKIH